MAEIVISEFMDEAAIEALLKGRAVLYDPELVDDPERLLAAMAQARAVVVRNRTQVDRQLLEAAPHLLAVGRLGVGLDNINLPACEARGVSVFPATGANDLAVAEYVIAAAMMLVRGAYHASDAVASGTWPRGALQGGEVFGKRMGLVGFGGIARQTAQRATALGMSVCAADPYLPEDSPFWRDADRVSLDDLLAQSDIVSLHVPLTEETRRLIDATAIEKMKDSAVLINAARGGVVDETALATALRKNKLHGAALDVFEVEPLSAEAGTPFEGLRNVILTPHIAGVTNESNSRVSHVTLKNILSILD